MDRIDYRNQTILQYNLAGILMNALLAVSKLIFGLRVHSRAIILDAINSLSDILSAVLSIASSYIGNMNANKRHPMGYGRIEYLFSILITFIIMFLGVRAIIEAFDGIFHSHGAPDYDTYSIVVMIVSFLCKSIYGIIMRIKGKEVSSTAMIMTGTDSLGDALVSIGIIAAIIIYRLTGVNIENYICIAISLMILYTGIGVLRESVAKILGTRNDEEYVAKIRSLLIMEEGVLNINNLVIHNYGENRYYGSADIEVNEEMRASQITKISRRLIRHAKKEGLILTSVGISGTNISDPEATEIWDKILGLIMNHEFILRAHSFAIDLEENVISFYVVLDYSVRDRVQLMKKFREELAGMYPDMTIEIFEAIDI